MTRPVSPLVRTLALPVTLLCAALTAAPAGAQNPRLAGQALHCSAVLSVLAVTHRDPSIAARLNKAVGILDEVYAAEQGGAAAGHLAEAQTRRKQLLADFRAQLAARTPYLREDSVVCGAWAEGFLAQGEQWSYVPVYPKVISATVRTQYETMAADAFERWQP